MHPTHFAWCCNTLLRAIYALQVCIATCVNTSRTSNASSGSLHCIIHRGARIITMHNAPSTTSTKKTPAPHALLLVQIWTTIFQWKSSLALHHNFQKCLWREEHRSNEAETRNVPCSTKMSQSDNQPTILKIEMAWQCSQHNKDTDDLGYSDLEISMDVVFCFSL